MIPCRYPEDQNCDCPDCRVFLQEQAKEMSMASDERYDVMGGAGSDDPDWYIE